MSGTTILLRHQRLRRLVYATLRNRMSYVPKPANDRLHPVLDRALCSIALDAPERPIIERWARRDPVDAAMDADLVWRRLVHDGATSPFDPSARAEVAAVQKEWTARYPAAVYLPAAERLLSVMNAWADSIITDAIAADCARYPFHP